MNKPHSHPLLFLRGVERNDLESILDFMYFVQVSIDMFLKIANEFELEGLNQKGIRNEEEKYECFEGLKTMKEEKHKTVEPNKQEMNDRFEKNPVIDKIFECQQCDSVFTSKIGLKYHT